jgi:hypothetical protein
MFGGLGKEMASSFFQLNLTEPMTCNVSNTYGTGIASFETDDKEAIEAKNSGLST